jgi:hypothetical protein
MMARREVGKVAFRGLVVGWLVSAVGFLAGEYGMGPVLKAILRTQGVAGFVTWMWLPWIVAPVVAGVDGGFANRCHEATRWWHWLIVGVPAPLGAYVITRWYFASHGEATPGLPADSLVQLAIVCGLTLGIGLARMARGRSTGRLPARPSRTSHVATDVRWQ